MRFEFSTTAQIIFGEGTLKEVGAIATLLGKHPLVICGKGAANPSALLASLMENGLDYAVFEVEGEPTIQLIENAIRLARQEKCDFVIGFGGGSAMDAAKSLACMMTNPGDLIDYLEVIGQGKKLSQPGLPVIAIPTTAGTGAEVTRNAVLASPEKKVKVSLRSPFLLPKYAIVDPALTYSLLPDVTASTGMDALTQLIEPFVSLRSNPLTDSICVEGIQKCVRSLVKAHQDGLDKKSREDMALASLFGGLALANAGLGAVHGFASVIGGMYSAPHGAICARLLAPVISTNIRALSAIKSEEHIDPGPLLKKYDEIARLLTRDPSARAEDGQVWLEDLQKQLEIPRLASYGVNEKDFGNIIERTLIASSTQANPVKLTAHDLYETLERAV